MVTFFPQGFRYVEKEGQCCSQRQQVARVANFPFGTVTIEVGKSYKAPYDNCTQYTCTESGGQFSSTTTVKVCLLFEQSNCVPVHISELEKKPPEMSRAIALGDFFTLSTLLTRDYQRLVKPLIQVKPLTFRQVLTAIELNYVRSRFCVSQAI
ncbi:mucin-5B-like isoform X1 [Coturnix japonica]|uniref:mucin-5B-like isoform X1 n=1 Tax=Coturnix japonica TaxID=93934 RepID=UPI000776E72E|nr:mucin-5B-like isoform X1 [Coturnix japonica]